MTEETQSEEKNKIRTAVIDGSHFNNHMLTASLLSQIKHAGVNIDVINPDDDEQLGKACDEAGQKLKMLHVVDSLEINALDHFSDPYDVDLNCQSDSSNEPYKPDWKPHRHKGGHKANARKSKKKK